MRRRRADGASISVLETVTVGIMVFGVVLYVAQINEPTNPESGAHARVEMYARDAVAVLAGLPSERGDMPSLLDELVADAQDGNESRLRAHMDKYFPPGVGYNVYLNNGHGSDPLIEDYVPRGPTVTVTRLVTLVEGRFFIFPSLDYAAGTSEDHKLDFYVIPLKNRFYYEHTPAELQFGSGVTWPLTVNESRGYLTAEGVPPELVGSPMGYTTQYDETDNTSFTASVVAKPGPVRFPVRTTMEHPTSGHAYYEVKTTASLDSELMDAIGAKGESHVEDGPRAKHRGSKVAIRYDYKDAVSDASLVGWTVTDKKVRIYSPADGLPVYEQKIDTLKGTVDYVVPKSAPYGTYVVEWEFAMVKDGVTQTARDVTLFPVTGSAGSSTLPPIYRVEVIAWLEGA